jgi:hypothetical protein
MLHDRNLPLFKMGTTKDSFQTTGKIPVDKDKLNKSVGGTLTTETNLLSMDGEMPSGSRLFCLTAPKWSPQLLSA